MTSVSMNELHVDTALNELARVSARVRASYLPLRHQVRAWLTIRSRTHSLYLFLQNFPHRFPLLRRRALI